VQIGFSILDSNFSEIAFFFFFLKTNRRPGYADRLFFTQRLWNLFHSRFPVRPGYVLRSGYGVCRSGYGVCRSGYGVLNCTVHRLLCRNRVLILRVSERTVANNHFLLLPFICGGLRTSTQSIFDWGFLPPVVT
jgi:hypothetical protein